MSGAHEVDVMSLGYALYGCYEVPTHTQSLWVTHRSCDTSYIVMMQYSRS